MVLILATGRPFWGKETRYIGKVIKKVQSALGRFLTMIKYLNPSFDRKVASC